MRSIHVLFSSIIFRPDYADLNLYSYILSRYFLGAFLGIAVINAAVNRYFKGVLGGVGNNSNTIIVYLFLYIGIKSFKGRIYFITLVFIRPFKVFCGIVMSGW